MYPVKQKCPSCGYGELNIFYEIENVPVHSVLLMRSFEEAINYSRGDINLGFCNNCGFITNSTFDPNLLEYSGRYEETQGYSATFNTFHKRLAWRLIDKYDLHGKDIIEIGCGKGEFLSLLCELGDNRGVGFDPAYVEGREPLDVKSQVTFIKDFYSAKYSIYKADLICCKMTLEHIHNVGEFVRTIRKSIGERKDTILFFQVPDVTRILNELAFWDIYYEHCSYFSPGSLFRLFNQGGFEVIDLNSDYEDQYLIIELKPKINNNDGSIQTEDDLEDLMQNVGFFSRDVQGKLEYWRRRVEKICQLGQRVVIWGAGSKGVAFLNTLKIYKEITYAVDINPNKHGTYMAGTGQKIVPSNYLQNYRPEMVIVMNPIYIGEIKRELARLGVSAELVAV